MSRNALFSSTNVGIAVVAATLGLASAVVVGPTLAGHTLGQWLFVASVSCGAILLSRFLSWGLVDVALVGRTGMRASSLVRMLTQWGLYLVAVLIIVKVVLDRDISTLLTGSAVLGAVGGFALQATLDNLFSGVALQLEHPFALGDVVKIGEVEGRVEAMSWRAVHLRTEGLSLMVIPNSTFGTEAVEVLQSAGSSERVVEIEADPMAPPGRVVQLLTDLVSGMDNVDRKPAPEVYAAALREWLGSRVYEVQYFPTDYLAYEPTEALIQKRAWYRLHRHGFGASSRSSKHGTAHVEPPERLSEASILRSLRTVPMIAALDDEAVLDLARAAQPILYTEDDPVSDLPDLSPALFVVHRGRLVAQAPGLLPHELRHDRLGDSSKLEAWTPRELSDAVTRLTEHLGPVAELLVHRTARLTVDPGRLYHLLALEISDLEARRQFLIGHPELATHELVPGDVFGVHSVFADEPPALDRILAATEVTLLRLPRAAVLRVLRARPDITPGVIQALKDWRRDHPARRLITLPSDEDLRALLTA